MESVDTQDLKSCFRKEVPVQVRPPVPLFAFYFHYERRVPREYANDAFILIMSACLLGDLAALPSIRPSIRIVVSGNVISDNVISDNGDSASYASWICSRILKLAHKMVRSETLNTIAFPKKIINSP